MTRTERTYYVLEGSFTLWGWFMVPVYPLFLMSRGLDVFEINVVLATYFLSTFLFEVPTGAVADYYGRKISFVLSCFVRMSAFVLYAFADGFVDCLIAEVIDGIGFTLASGALQAWAVDGVRAEGDERPTDAMFSRAMMIARGLMIAGGVAGGALADIDLGLPWLVAGAGFGLVGIYALFAMQEPRRSIAPAQKFSLGAQIRGGFAAARGTPVVRLICVLTVLIGAGIVPVSLAWPVRLESVSGQGLWVLGWAWALINVAAVLGALLNERVLLRIRREIVLFASYLVRAAAIVVASLSDTFLPILAALLVAELAFAVGYPSLQAWLNEHIESSERATVLSVVQMSFTFGASTGCLAIGMIAQQAGVPASWLVAALLFAVAAPGYLLLARVSRRAPALSVLRFRSEASLDAGMGQ